jgi:hypothetical protein
LILAASPIAAVSTQGYSLYAIREWRMPIVLKPQDILVLLKLIAVGRQSWAYGPLAVELGMSPSEVHSAIKRAQHAELVNTHEGVTAPNVTNLEEFLIHGLKYAFKPDRGELTRGIPTAYAAPPLASQLAAGDEPPPVWPDPEGNTRGISFSPLYKAATFAARRDAKLYELLALVDAIRGGRARERQLATRELQNRLKTYTSGAAK